MIRTANGQAINVAASCNAITGSSKQSVIAGGLAADDYHLGEPTHGGGFQLIAFSKNTIDGKKVGIESRAGSSIVATDNTGAARPDRTPQRLQHHRRSRDQQPLAPSAGGVRHSR